MGGNTQSLPEAFVSALDISAIDHMLMVASVAPYVDAAISKTVNVPADYPYDAFKNLYLQAWHKGLKGITTYRPNAILGAVLSVPVDAQDSAPRSEEHTSELQSLMRISYAVFCLKKTTNIQNRTINTARTVHTHQQ